MSEADRSRPVRVGLVGAGAVAQVAHLPVYERLRSVDLVGLCDLEAPKLRILKERTNVRVATRDLEDLLAMDDLDAVDICLPNHLHADAILRALEAGKHVLCEKPLAPTSEEVGRILEAAGRSGRVVLVGMNHRYRDDSIALKRFVEDGALGSLFHIGAVWRKRRESIRPGAWHYRREASGGGVIMDLGITLLDLALWLADYPRVERVTASFWSHNPEIDVEDTAVATLRCEGDLTIALEASWHLLTNEKQEMRMRVNGSEGSGVFPPLAVFQRMHGSQVDVTPRPQRRMANVFMESYEREIAFFAEVASGREEAPPLEENRVLARVLEAIGRSAEEGREVDLPVDAGSGA